ncbi:hypothetical protein O181_028074 [Austropuccinia psidii MF-1]|uniref:Zinc finger CHCC-type domain-containing protein n=1 Tax=Austropuccinia psidii MF-1 TaxID=1389203 RepID=A0A9Q3CQ19_9BASI|nr:hypothetical protein [Austropuccinia psidii MF-1]
MTYRKLFTGPINQVRQARNSLHDPLLKRRSYQTAVEKVSPSNDDQAPNRVSIWSRNQKPKSQAMIGPRFEQTNMNAQPNPLAAIELIAQEPIRMVSSRIAACDGGGGALGHPKVFINLDKPGPHACPYCGLRYECVSSRHDDDH